VSGGTGRDLGALPKAHLHLHLEGAMRPSTLAELSDRYGIAMPVVSGFGSFTAFADMYVGACEVLRTADDLVRLINEVVDDAAQAGAVWIEPAFYQPRYRDRLGTDEQILELFLDAIAAAGRRTGVGVGLMVAADRTVDPAEATAQARLAARYAEAGVVSFGLANDEAVGPPEPFAEAYAIARPVLNARSPEQIKDTLTIPCIDAATVVANLVGDRSIRFGRSDLDAPRYAGPQILDRVVHEIREHLFEGETVAGDRGKVSNADLGVNVSRLMSQSLQSRSQQLRHVDELRLKLTLPLARQLEKGAYESIHFRNR